MSKRDIRLMIEDVKFGSRGVGVLKKNNKMIGENEMKNDEISQINLKIILIFDI